jgi:acyl-CoA thioesterase-1
VALGGNDGLRGIEPRVSKANLAKILDEFRAAKVPVLLAGMLAPPNLGREYGTEFNAMFADLAQSHSARLYPFILDGVAGDAAFNQPDGIHPNARGVDRIVERLLPSVLALIGG